MKMTLSSNNMSNDNRSSSPTSSPRSSPRPSPRPQNKREHVKSDTYLSVSYKEVTLTTQKNDVTPPVSSSDLNISLNKNGTNEANITPPLTEIPRPESIGGSSSKDKKDSRSKKKSAWYNVLYPTYKSRSEDFKLIFKDVPDDERLVVDYSCALQKEILVQGRLYVSQNYLCFYANIFGWETNVYCKWKDVTAITKEKTALVIPNAILIATKSDRYFFTSFVARDKTYLMLFRVWQNALMERPMNQQEMWQLVHDSYGAELGLTSDDEDYIAPGTEDEKFSARLSVESQSEDGLSTIDPTNEPLLIDSRFDDDNVSVSPSESRIPLPSTKIEMKKTISDSALLPTDMSDTSESDREKEKSLSPTPRSSNEHNTNPLNSYNPDPNRSSSDEKLYPVCSALHEGRQLMNEVIPLHVDQVFTLLFTSSKFFLDFHASRKTADLMQTTWSYNAADNTKTRDISLTVALNQPVGPKTAQVTEKQIMLPCSKAGFLYSIDVETANAGIPYADSFCILVHFCIHRISDTQSSIAVYAQIKYKKSVWGLVKGMIEKNCWQGLEDFYSCLAKALLLEAEETSGTAVKRKSRRRIRPQGLQTIQKFSSDEISPIVRGSSSRVRGTTGRTLPQTNFATLIVFGVLILLVMLNILLYYKLWSLEEVPPHSVIDLQILKDPPKSHEEWIKLLQKQETLHTFEMQKWQKILKTAIKLLKQTEDSLNELQRSIHPKYTNKIMSIIENKEHDIDHHQSEDL